MQSIFKLFNRICASKRGLVVLVFSASILFSLVFLVFFSNIGPAEHKDPGTDYFVRYEPMAENILQGKGITIDGGVYPEYAPGFPVFLAGVFLISKIIGIARLDLVVVLNVILTAFSSCFLFLIAKEIFSKKIALISAFLWMTYPFNLWFIKNPNTETLFIPLFYLGIFFYILAVKRKKMTPIFWGGVFLSLATLVRLTTLFLPLLFLIMIFLFLRKESKKTQILMTLVLLAGLFIAIFPWAMYSFLHTGSFVPVSTMGSRGAAVSFKLLLESEKQGYGISLSDDMRLILEKIKTAGEAVPEQNVYPILIKEFTNNPFAFIKIIILIAARSWYATTKMWWEDKILLVQGIYLISAFSGMLYWIKSRKSEILNLIFLLGIIVYFWGMNALSASILRYMVPVMGLIMIFLAVVVNAIIEKLFKKFKLNFLCRNQSSQ